MTKLCGFQTNIQVEKSVDGIKRFQIGVTIDQPPSAMHGYVCTTASTSDHQTGKKLKARVYGGGDLPVGPSKRGQWKKK